MPNRQDVGYGTATFARVPFTGYSNPAGAGSQQRLGVPFLVGNDRYQVVICSDSGDSSTIPTFRYWYAGGVPYGETINLDENFPTYHTVDEDGDPVMADLELSFTETKTPAEVEVDYLYVEFTPQPLVVDPSGGAFEVGFTARVEGYGLPNFATSVGQGQTTGVISSDMIVTTITLAAQTDEPWPNTRTVKVPVRFASRVRAFRPILTDITLCEINRVQMFGTQHTIRDV